MLLELGEFDTRLSRERFVPVFWLAVVMMGRHGSKEELAFNDNWSGKSQRIIHAVDDGQYTSSGEWFLPRRNSEGECII